MQIYSVTHPLPPRGGATNCALSFFNGVAARHESSSEKVSEGNNKRPHSSISGA